MDLIYIDPTNTPADPTQTESHPPQPSSELTESSPLSGRDPFISSHRHRHRAPQSTAEARLAELERENHRLQRLVAELLIKNQQLRKCP